MTYDEINSELKMLLCKNKLRNEGDFIFAEYLGDVGIEINASIQIGHIAHMRDTLMKLSDTKSSPIADDGYTGIDIFELDTSGTLRFRLDIHYIAEAMDQIKLFMIAEGVNENEIDFVFQRCEKLSTLGFQSISLIYDPIQVDWYQERQLKLNQRREEENVEHYNVTDYMTIPEDYKEE